MKPIVIISFEDGIVHWASCGWGNSPKLMKLAKQAINQGEDPEQVVALLELHFEVMQTGRDQVDLLTGENQ